MKRIYLWIAMVCLVFAMAVPAVVAAQPPVDTVQTTPEARSEEFIWVTRVYNGKQQKRLWSVTNACWMTDWIDC